MDKKYARAYTEVLEILKHIPEDELDKIPKTEIQFYENNCDKNYRYDYNQSLSVDKQIISREANTVIIAIYMNYFANEKQKGIIEKILKQNTIEEEKIKSEKYNIDEIFQKNKNIADKSETFNAENLPIEINKNGESFIKKIINKIKSIFKKEKISNVFRDTSQKHQEKGAFGRCPQKRQKTSSKIDRGDKNFG